MEEDVKGLAGPLTIFGPSLPDLMLNIGLRHVVYNTPAFTLDKNTCWLFAKQLATNIQERVDTPGVFHPCLSSEIFQLITASSTETFDKELHKMCITSWLSGTETV